MRVLDDAGKTRMTIDLLGDVGYEKGRLDFSRNSMEEAHTKAKSEILHEPTFLIYAISELDI